MRSLSTLDEHLHEPARLTDGLGTQDRRHGDPRHAHSEPPLLRRGLVEPHSRKFRIDERAIGDESIARRTRFSREVVSHHAEVIQRHVCELGASSAFAHRPDAGRGGLKALVYLDEAPCVEFDAGALSPISRVFGVRPAATRMSEPSIVRVPAGVCTRRRTVSPERPSTTLWCGAKHDLDTILFEHRPERPWPRRDLHGRAVAPRIPESSHDCRNAGTPARTLPPRIRRRATMTCDGSQSSSSASTWVSGRAAARPGTSGTVARVPRLRKRRSATMRRGTAVRGIFTSIVRGPTRDPSPRRNSRCATENFFWCVVIRPSTIVALALPVYQPCLPLGPRSARRTRRPGRRGWRPWRFESVLAWQAGDVGHEPPIKPRSITTTGRPCCARSQARYLPASPPPRTAFSMCMVSVMVASPMGRRAHGPAARAYARMARVMRHSCRRLGSSAAHRCRDGEQLSHDR